MNSAAPREGGLRAAWRSVRRAGFIAPELPTVVFIAVATGAGFNWGLGCGVVVLGAVIVIRVVRSLPLRTVIGGAVGLAIAAVIARVSGVAANGLVTDMVIDLGLAAALLGSVLAGHPLFRTLWKQIHRLPHPPDGPTMRAYSATTALAGAVLLVRGLALTGVFLAGESVGLLLAVKVALGPPGTLLVIAACYAAGGLERPAVPPPSSDIRAAPRRTAQGSPWNS